MAASLAPSGDRIDEALLEYLHAVDAGNRPDRDAFLARYPDIATELSGLLLETPSLDRAFNSLGRRGIREPDLTSPERFIGDYELLGRIGGNMGIVYRARQRSLPRDVAVKLLLRPGEADRRQFRNEAEAMAQLKHPNIVRIFEVAETNGLPHFSMEFYSGGSLDRKLEHYVNDPLSAARLVAQVARSLHHAHQRGILHRDLKPANILLDESGNPYVADFGLAARIWTNDTVDGPTRGAGTPAYMAPEQITGDVTIATDIHGLGALLYALLTGEAPFKGDKLDDILDQVKSHTPEAPSHLNRRANLDLDAVCLKCLQKQPADRYAHAEEVAEELERCVRREPTLVRPVGILGRLGRLIGQNQSSEFRPMANLMFLQAFTHLIANGAAYLLMQARAAEPWIWLPICGCYLPFFFILTAIRVRNRTATTPARRHLWSIWIGHFLATVTALVVMRFWTGDDYILALQRGYALISILAGLAYFIMGSIYAGWQYLAGIGWLALAIVLAFVPEFAPLLYALGGFTCTFISGVRLSRLAKPATPVISTCEEVTRSYHAKSV